MSDGRSYGEGGPYRSDDAPQAAQYDPNGKISNLRKEVDGTRVQLGRNIEGLNERGGNLDTLQGQTGELADSSGQFARSANRVRKQMWWKDMKMRMCLIAGIIILLLVIIIPSVVATRH